VTCCTTGDDIADDWCDWKDGQDSCSLLQTIGCKCCGDESEGCEYVNWYGQIVCLQRGVSVDKGSVGDSQKSTSITYPSPLMIVGRKVPNPKRAMEAEKKLAEAI
jgi:hypothetical protein